MQNYEYDKAHEKNEKKRTRRNLWPLTFLTPNRNYAGLPQGRHVYRFGTVQTGCVPSYILMDIAIALWPPLWIVSNIIPHTE